MDDATAKAYFPKQAYFWSPDDEVDHRDSFQEPSGPWDTQGDGVVYSIHEIADATASAGKFHWDDEEDTHFYPSLTAHLRFTKAERHKQQQNAAVVVGYIFKVRDDKEKLWAAWQRVADRYSQEKSSWISPWDYAIINNTIRRLLDR